MIEKRHFTQSDIVFFLFLVYIKKKVKKVFNFFIIIIWCTCSAERQSVLSPDLGTIRHGLREEKSFFSFACFLEQITDNHTVAKILLPQEMMLPQNFILIKVAF